MVNWVLHVFVFTLVLAGCATPANKSDSRFEMPNGWGVVKNLNSRECAQIDGTYDNLGSGYIAAQSESSVARLDVSLGLPLPSNRVPQLVKITRVPGKNVIQFVFEGLARQEFTRDFECHDGWYTLSQERNHEYLGDGVVMDNLSLRISLAISTDDELIVHHFSEEKYTTYFLFRTESSLEGWFKFERR